MRIINMQANSLDMKKTRFIIKRMGAKMGTKTMNIDYPTMRKISEKAQSMMKKAENVQFQKSVISGVSVEMAVPRWVDDNRIVIYIHGGGFATGNAMTSRAYASYLASEGHFKVVSVSYRLAPENPFPAGLEDCVSVYQGIRNMYPQSSVALVGESAGATLSIAVSLHCLEHNFATPDCICLFSPVTDLTGSLMSHEVNVTTDIQMGSGGEEEIKRIYSSNYPMDNPYISPLKYDNSLSAFPPTMLVVDKDEVLYDDSVYFAKKIDNYGVECILYIYKNTFHAFPITGLTVPEGRRVLCDTIDFLKIH